MRSIAPTPTIRSVRSSSPAQVARSARAPISAQAATFASLEGVTTSGVVATFSYPDPNVPAGDFVAAVERGLNPSVGERAEDRQGDGCRVVEIERHVGARDLA